MANLIFKCERDPTLYYKRGRLKVGDKVLETPIKSLDLSKITSETQMNSSFRGLNESLKIFHQNRKMGSNPQTRDRVVHWSLTDYRSSTKLTEDLSSYCQTLKNKAKENEISIFFTGFDGDKCRYPTDGELRYMLVDSQKSSDIVPIPTITNMPEKMNLDSFNKYIDFLERSYNEIKKFNNKPIMGIIPCMGPIFIPDLVKFYLDKKDIKSFFFDFNGKTPTKMYSYFVHFFKELEEYTVFDNTFVHAINVNMGRTSKKEGILDSKDILCFGYGIDGLGRQKVNPPRINIGGKPPDTSENRIRLFAKNDYGLYKLKDSEIEKVYPSDTGVPLKELQEVFPKKSDKRKYPNMKPVNVFNIEQLGLEACRLRGVISEGKSEKYIDKKTYASEIDKNQIKKMSSRIKGISKTKQTRLDA